MVRPQPSPYVKVEVRGLYWEEVPGVEEFHMVMNAFQTYGFSVKRLPLPTTENELTAFPSQLQHRVYEIGASHPSTLVILYYQGHGNLDETGHLFLSNNGSRMHFNEIANAMINAPCDVLTILNCCHAGAAAMSSVATTRPNYENRIKQVMMATATDQKTPYGCADGFSASFEQALREQRFNWQPGFRGKPSQWADAINRVMHTRVGKKPVTVQHMAMPPDFYMEKPIIVSPMMSAMPWSPQPSPATPAASVPVAPSPAPPPMATSASSRPIRDPVRPPSRQATRPPSRQAIRSPSPGPGVALPPSVMNWARSRSQSQSHPQSPPPENPGWQGMGPMVVNMISGGRRINPDASPPLPPDRSNGIRSPLPTTSKPGLTTTTSQATQKPTSQARESQHPPPVTRGRGMSQSRAATPARGVSQTKDPATRGRGLSQSRHATQTATATAAVAPTAKSPTTTATGSSRPPPPAPAKKPTIPIPTAKTKIKPPVPTPPPAPPITFMGKTSAPQPPAPATKPKQKSTSTPAASKPPSTQQKRSSSKDKNKVVTVSLSGLTRSRPQQQQHQHRDLGMGIGNWLLKPVDISAVTGRSSDRKGKTATGTTTATAAAAKAKEKSGVAGVNSATAAAGVRRTKSESKKQDSAKKSSGEVHKSASSGSSGKATTTKKRSSSAKGRGWLI